MKKKTTLLLLTLLIVCTYAHSQNQSFGYVPINDNQLYLSPNGNIGVGTSSPSTLFEINNGTLKLSGYIGNDEENARFVIHTDNATNYNFMELRNINGVQFKVTGTGIVYAKEIKVMTNIPTPDYVFEKDYNLMTISELEKFIFQNKHLPNVPSAKEVEETGMNLASLSNVLLEKVEELTLYTIQQQKLIEELIESQNNDREFIKNLQDQINRLKYESE